MEDEIPKNTWFSQAPSQVVNAFESSLDKGLSLSEAETRLIKFGKNRIPIEKKTTLFSMILNQLSDFMIVILIFASILAGALGEIADSIAVLVIIVINACIGVIQEYKAEEALDALQKMTTPHSLVLRNGLWSEISSDDLVPGDIVKIEAGNVISADMRVLQGSSLKTEEAALTGESVSVEKSHSEINENTVLAERTSMVYKGTLVSYGHAIGIVTATGLNTEFGKIANLLKSEKRVATPLQRKMEIFGKKLTWFLLLICLLIFIFGVLRGETWIEMLMTSVSLAVAAIPEALPAVLTISLALGARTLVKRNALVQRLPAVETLGTVTYICSDKTGTLTENKMSVDEIWTLNLPEEKLISSMYMNNDTEIGENKRLIGEPTETSMFRYALDECKNSKNLNDFSRVGEIPFDSTVKRMTTVHQNTKDSSFQIIVKGALESILPLCDNIDPTIEKKAHSMASDGLRVLAFAIKSTKSKGSEADWNSGLSFLGLVGLIDPPRKESEDAVRECKNAGIIPLMITGDHPVTALAIAKRVGIVSADDTEVITGSELSTFSDDTLKDHLKKTRVFSRMTPEQKIRIVKILQEEGEYVAMTGDGVNDAPSLKRADIGIAMGITGTDVARKAAHMTLLDDNFSTIVKAIREGRRIFDNIKKFIKFALIGNSGEVLTIFLAPIFGLSIPLLPIHILWVNLITDGMPGLAFSKETEEEGIMSRKPRDVSGRVFDKKFIRQILMYGTLISAVTLIGYSMSLSKSEVHAQSVAFTILTFSQLILVLELRRKKESLFSKSFFSNPSMLFAVGLGFLFHFLILYIPVLNGFFKTVPLGKSDLILSFGLVSIIGFVFEIEKLINKLQYRSV